jgi:hypothetical protein
MDKAKAAEVVGCPDSTADCGSASARPAINAITTNASAAIVRGALVDLPVSRYAT